MNYLKFTHDKLNIEQLQQLASNCERGEISIFIETTGDTHCNRQEASHLSYEAYESMAVKVLEVICAEIRQKWPEVENIVMYFRLGNVPAQEASIVIAISSLHRKDAVCATEWCITYVKSRVPIWKKERDDVKIEKSEGRENHECARMPVLNRSDLYDSKPKRKIYSLKRKQRVHLPHKPRPHQIQIKVKCEEHYDKIKNLMNEKRAEVDRNNIQEFIKADRDTEFRCSRVDSPFKKRPDSNSHLPVNTVMNTFHRDQFNADYLLACMPPNGIEERLKNLEAHLGITVPFSFNIDERLKNIEDRVRLLESLSPEYDSFWKKTGVFTKAKTNKRVFSVDDIDLLIENLEKEMKKGLIK